MAPSRVVVTYALCLSLCTTVFSQGSKAKDPLDVAWQLSFDGLEAAGCLPEDFKHPDFSPCVEEGSAGGPALYQALDCVADRFEISTSDGLQIDSIYEMINNLSAEESWIASQKQNVDICKDMMNVTVLTTPKQQGTFMLSCVRRLQNHQCRLNMMQQLGTKNNAEESVETGQALVLMLDSGCLDSVKNSDDEESFARCSSGTALDFRQIIGGVNWAKGYTNLLVDASSTGNEETPPTDTEVATAKEQLALLNSAILCTMRATGAIGADGTVNYPRVLQSVSESSGRPVLKHVKAAVITECEKQGASSGEEFLQCYFRTAPYACTSLYSHSMVLLKGHQHEHTKAKPDASNVDVASTLSFAGLEAAGCLPEDFSAPNFRPCVKERSKGGPALYQALDCIAERFRLSTSSGLQVNALNSMINSMSSDAAWTSQQRQNVDICKLMMNSTVLKTTEQQGIFMLSCLRKVQQHQCRLGLAQRLGKDIDARVDGFVQGGQTLVRLLDGNCMDSIKNANDEKAFNSCAADTALDMGIIGYAMKSTAHYTRVVEDGSSSIDNLPVPLEADAASLVEQLELFDSAILCTMRASGGVKANGTVDYAQVQQSISESTGRPELIQLQAAVTEGCRKQGVTDGEGFLKCYYDTAPYACNSLQSHVMVLLKGRTLHNLQAQTEELNVDVESALSFAGLEAAGCLPEDFSAPNFRPCVEEGSKGGPALYQALDCVAERSQLSTCSSLDVNNFYSMVNRASSESNWTSQQRDNIDLCKAMMNTTVLTTVNQQAIFMLSCVRKIQQHQCRLNMMQQLATKVNVEGVVETGQALVQMLEGSCMDDVKNADDEKAFANCTSLSGPNMDIITGAVGWAGNYTRLVTEGGKSGTAVVAPPSEADVTRVQTELASLDSAILCTMRATGGIRDDGSVDYSQVQLSISESSGRPELVQLQSAVVEGCRKQGVTDGEGFLHCYYQSAPYACLSLHAHVMVLLKGHRIGG